MGKERREQREERKVKKGKRGEESRWRKKQVKWKELSFDLRMMSRMSRIQNVREVMACPDKYLG